jgi:hypothetical protein
MGKMAAPFGEYIAVMVRLHAALISAVFLLGQIFLTPAYALDPLPAPTGKIILTLDGRIALHNTADGKAAFDLAMLQALPVTRFRTSTIWTDGVQAFEGVSIANLLARVGSEGSEIQAVAANDYEIRFPVSDASDHGGLIAYQINGSLLPVSNKGPLWIVYPFDRDPDLQTERFQGESVWSLETMTLN